MPRKKEKQGKGAGWLTTMSDMNMLLLVFFVMLFSLLSWEENRYVRLEGEPQQHGMPEGTHSVNIVDIQLGVAKKLLESYLESNAARETVVQIEGQYARIARAPEGVVMTVGGEFEPFVEGQYKLRPQHYKILDAVYTWMQGRDNKIIIRGYTAQNMPDSLVLEKGTWRQWRGGDPNDPNDPGDPNDAADWRTLGYFRAREAANYLINRPSPIGPRRLTVQSEGAWGTRKGTRTRIAKPGGRTLNLRQGENFIDAYLREKERERLEEWRKNRRVDVVVVPSAAGS